MAPDGSPSQDLQRTKKKTIRKENEDVKDEVQVNIEKLTTSGHGALKRGDSTKALDYFKRAYRTAVKLGDSKVQRVCAFNLGAAYVEAGKPQKGLDLLSQAEPGERGERVADLQFNLAAAHQALKDYVPAVRHYQRAAQLYRSQGDGTSEGDACVRLARCHLRKKEWAETAESYLRAAESYKLVGKLGSAALALKDAGKHMLRCDGFSEEDAVRVLTDCLELSAQITEKATLAELFNAVGLSFSQLKLLSEAAECYELALPLVRSAPRRLAVVMQNLGAIHNSLGQYQKSLEYHREAAALHGALRSRQAQGRCFCNLGHALTELGELEEAAESYLHAQQAFRDTGDSSGQWKVCEGLGGIRMRTRDPEKAVVHYKRALALLSESENVSSSPQEHLVNKLSEALQLQLAVQQRGIPARRAIQERTLTRQQQRAAQTRHAEDAMNEQGGRGRPGGRRVEGRETYGRRKPHGDAVTTSNVTHTERHDYVNTLPEANRNLNNTHEDPDRPHQTDLEPQKDKPLSEGSEPNPVEPLSEHTETVPPAHAHSEEASSQHRRISSRFCTIM
ncbi:tetratricopeptide repeat protein 24 [Trichomycterus rosablanca]|uniref:tetratricopeptide repeat protein 24 n=1 Tax=Trichomycterus rosablanca TaxID=2290929 RepID=UPI002F35BBA3